MIGLRLREAYTPPILVAAMSRPTVAVGAVAHEAVPLDFSRGLPISTVGADDGHEVTAGERVMAAVFIAPFLAGPPLAGYYLLGTFGAVAGALWAAPAIYLYVRALGSGQLTFSTKEGA